MLVRLAPSPNQKALLPIWTLDERRFTRGAAAGTTAHRPSTLNYNSCKQKSGNLQPTLRRGTGLEEEGVDEKSGQVLVQVPLESYAPL